MIRKKPDHIWKMIKYLKIQSVILIIWHLKDQGGLQSPWERLASVLNRKKYKNNLAKIHQSKISIFYFHPHNDVSSSWDVGGFINTRSQGHDFISLIQSIKTDKYTAKKDSNPVKKDLRGHRQPWTLYLPVYWPIKGNTLYYLFQSGDFQ